MGGYTPGPWTVLTFPDEKFVEVRANEGYSIVSHVFLSNGDRDANARLISQAPSLVAVLTSSEELLSFYEGCASPEFDGAEPTVRFNGKDLADLLANIRAAISRATGEGE